MERGSRTVTLRGGGPRCPGPAVRERRRRRVVVRLLAGNGRGEERRLACGCGSSRRRGRRRCDVAARLTFSEWWQIGLRTEDRRADAKKAREENNRLKNEANEAGEGEEGSDKAVTLLEFVGIMFELLKPYKKMFAFALVTLLLAAGIELMLPHYTAKTIFSIQKGDTALFHRCVKTLLGLSAAFSVIASLRGMTFGFLNQRFVYKLRTGLFENLLRQDITFHDQADVGMLTSRLTSDCSSMSRILGMNINLLIRNVFKTIGGAIYLWIMSPKFFAQTLLSLAVILAINIRYGMYSRKAAQTEQEQLALGNQIATEVLTLIRTVRIFGTEKMETNKYVRSLEQLIRIGTRQIVAYGMFLTSATFLVNATEAFCLLYGGVCCLRGEITAEQLTSFLFYIEFVVQSALASSEQVANINTAVGSSERVLNLLKRKPNEALLVQSREEGESSQRTLEDFQGNLEFVGVSFAYPDLSTASDASGESELDKSAESHHSDSDGGDGQEKKMTLSKINLSLKPGTVTALVGPSGGGKSTLVALLQYLYQPTVGIILADGVPIDELDVEWYRSQIGYVEQEPKLFDLPIGENIAYGSGEGFDRVSVERAAVEANAMEFIRKMPEYLDTWVGNSSLSGGQRQRVALARALRRNPKVLILDEATSALDAQSEFQVQKAIAMGKKDKSVLVIAHKLSTVIDADRILVLKDGVIVEEGGHYDLLARKGVYHKLASIQGVDLAPHCEPPPKKAKIDNAKEEKPRGANVILDPVDRKKSLSRDEESDVALGESLDESVDQVV